MTSGSRVAGPESAGLRRGFAFLVLAGTLVTGLVTDEGLGRPVRRGSWIPLPAPEAPQQSLVTEPDTLSASWYCAEGTSNDGGRADETVVIANAGEQPLEAVVTVLLGDAPPARRALEVAPRSRAELRIADLAKVEEPGVVVEVFGGSAAVEHVVRAAGDLAAAPCARRPTTQWLFAGGATLKDVSDTLALFNPFDDDAVVDMTFFTEDGVVQPEALQAFVVPGRSRVSVPVQDHVLRKEIAAAELRTRTGRIVAERSIQWDGTTGRRGLGLYLGANETAESWTFPEGHVDHRVFEDVWVFNPGRSATEVEIQPDLEGDAIQEPTVASVPARSAISVRMNDSIAAGTAHALRVTATGEEDVVVAQELLSATGAPREGYALVPGITSPARAWVFPAGSADDVFDEWIIVTNSGTDTTRVTISVLAGGLLLVPEGLGDLEVKPFERRAVRLGDSLKRTDLPVLVEADAPIEAERALFEGAGVSYSPGAPFPEP
ncbi:MAG: hypothetical protein HYU28_04575 [Actinobacteria bacterium]|nr:hypothetical protein [Actinomycetota bacterium]